MPPLARCSIKRQRRTFSTKFKHEAACLLLDRGYPIPEGSRSLDVGETALRRWVQQLKLERDGATPASRALTGEQKRIQEFEARVHRLDAGESHIKKGYRSLNAGRDESILRFTLYE